MALGPTARCAGKEHDHQQRSRPDAEHRDAERTGLASPAITSPAAMASDPTSQRNHADVEDPATLLSAYSLMVRRIGVDSAVSGTSADRQPGRWTSAPHRCPAQANSRAGRPSAEPASRCREATRRCRWIGAVMCRFLASAGRFLVRSPRYGPASGSSGGRVDPRCHRRRSPTARASPIRSGEAEKGDRSAGHGGG